MAKDKSLPAHVSELWELVVAYLKQETVEPIKNLGRFVGFGMLGSILLCIGLPLLILATLRAVQAEGGSAVTGSLNWLPYLAAVVLSAVFAGLAAWGIARKSKSATKPAGKSKSESKSKEANR